MARPSEHIISRIAMWASLAIVAVLIDLVIAPHLLGPLGRRWFTLSVGAGVVILCGMRHGSFAGLACGWWTAWIVCALTNASLGFSLLSYGLVGFASGFTGGITGLRFAPFDIIVLGGLLLGEGILTASLLSVWGNGLFQPDIPGRVLTVLLLAPSILRHPPGARTGSLHGRRSTAKSLTTLTERPGKKSRRRSKGMFADA